MAIPPNDPSKSKDIKQKGLSNYYNYINKNYDTQMPPDIFEKIMTGNFDQSTKDFYNNYYARQYGKDVEHIKRTANPDDYTDPTAYGIKQLSQLEGESINNYLKLVDPYGEGVLIDYAPGYSGPKRNFAFDIPNTDRSLYNDKQFWSTYSMSPEERKKLPEAMQFDIEPTKKENIPTPPQTLEETQVNIPQNNYAYNNPFLGYSPPVQTPMLIQNTQGTENALPVIDKSELTDNYAASNNLGDQSVQSKLSNLGNNTTSKTNVIEERTGYATKEDLIAKAAANNIPAGSMPMGITQEEIDRQKKIMNPIDIELRKLNQIPQQNVDVPRIGDVSGLTFESKQKKTTSKDIADKSKVADENLDLSKANTDTKITFDEKGNIVKTDVTQPTQAVITENTENPNPQNLINKEETTKVNTSPIVESNNPFIPFLPSNININPDVQNMLMSPGLETYKQGDFYNQPQQNANQPSTVTADQKVATGNQPASTSNQTSLDDANKLTNTNPNPNPNPTTNNPISTTGNYVPDLLNPKQKSFIEKNPFLIAGTDLSKVGNIQSNQPQTNPPSFVPNPDDANTVIGQLQQMYPSYDYSGPDQQTTEPKSTQQIMQEKLFPEKFKSETGIAPDKTDIFEMLDNSGFYNQKLGMEFNKPFMPGTENIDNTEPKQQVTSDGKVTAKGTVKPPKQPGAKRDSKFKPDDYYLAKGLMDTVALFNNMIQPPPPGIAMKLPHAERMRLDRTPYELQRTLAKEAQTQSNRAMREGMSQASDMMKANAASQGVTQEQLRQVGGQEAQAFQTIDQMNQQISTQENAAQTDVLNKEAITNYEIQARAKEAKDANINKQLEQVGNTMGAYAHYLHSKDMSEKMTKNMKQQADASNRIQLAMLENEMVEKELGSESYKEAERKAINDYMMQNRVALLGDERYKTLKDKYGESYDPLMQSSINEERANNIKSGMERVKQRYKNFETPPVKPTIKDLEPKKSTENDDDFNKRKKQYDDAVAQIDKDYQIELDDFNENKKQYDEAQKVLDDLESTLKIEKQFQQDLRGSYQTGEEKRKFQSEWLKNKGLPESMDILQTVKDVLQSYRQ